MLHLQVRRLDFSTRNTVTIQKSKLCFVFLFLFVWNYVQPSAVEKVLLYSHIFRPFLITGCGKGLQNVSAESYRLTSTSYHLQSVQIRGWKSAGFCFLYSLYSLVCYLLLAHRCWTWSKCCLCQSSCDLHWLQVILYQKQIGCTWHCDPTFRPLRPNQSS